MDINQTHTSLTSKVRKTLFSIGMTGMLFSSMSLLESAQALTIRGVDFPQGNSSFADRVLRYDPLFSGGPAPGTSARDASQALGRPDYSSSAGGSVTLGNGGLLDLAFDDNFLTNSGSAAADLYIFEVGPDVEATFISILPTAATRTLIGNSGQGRFLSVGGVGGSTSAIDIDAFFPGFEAGQLIFNAVRLVDNPDPSRGDTTGFYVGADIDAVGAISSIPRPIPTPALLPGLIGMGVAALKKHQQQENA